MTLFDASDRVQRLVRRWDAWRDAPPDDTYPSWHETWDAIAPEIGHLSDEEAREFFRAIGAL